jgi:hypothetical protein
MVEGVFSRSSRSAIRPSSSVGACCARWTTIAASTSAADGSCPNAFTFHLSPRDTRASPDIDEALNVELCEAVREYARDEGYHFLGPSASR